MSVGIMASVRGTLIFNRVPSPSFESISTVPLSWAILVFTTSMPTPRPETSEISFLVEKPGAKIKPKASVSDRDRKSVVETGMDDNEDEGLVSCEDLML